MSKKEPAKKKADRTPRKPYPVVAIGASAGGIEAVSELFRNLSPSTGMAYVYIQHLDPTHESMLTSILSKTTSMNVVEARSLMRLKPNTVFVIPPNRNMVMVDGVLKLKVRPPHPNIHLPINEFFVSLAQKRKEGAIGIVLSGNANDGAQGLKAIKIAGGLTFVQDESAKFQSMPRSAVAEGVVDLVLSPKEIAEELESLSKQSGILHIAMAEGDVDITPEVSEDDINNILSLLNKSTGVDFTHYKRNTITRRIIRRMLLHQLPTLREYSQYLRQHRSEIKILYQDLLINVTSFFRDNDSVEFFRKTVLPKILKSKRSGEPVRIWVAACSTGEEAYSLAMLMVEMLGERKVTIPVQIFATDLSELAISRARVGIYSKSEVAEISPRRLQRFFTKVDGSFRIIKSIRDLCIFAPHNIFKDPPFSRLDLISCCNLLIYLDPILQKKIIATFHYALNPVGYLMLGKSETIGSSGGLFTAIDKKVKIYQRKKDSSARAIFEMNYRIPDSGKYKMGKSGKIHRKDTSHLAGLEKLVDNILLTRYVPASVVVNEDLEIIQFRGSTATFLEPAPGKASLNLLKMTKASLGFELRNIVHKVGKTGEPFKKTGLAIPHNGVDHSVTIEVAPLPADGDGKYYLILFSEMLLAGVPAGPAISRDKRIKELNQELSNAKADMRSMIEEQEAVNEELQSANEEVVSSNEELQSINEELETSKEEVESTNEELMTVNSEMQTRNEQLTESFEYAEAVIDTIREAALVLDATLTIKTASKSFYKIFGLTPEEVEGRLIYELDGGHWNIPKLRELIEDIIPTNLQIQGFELVHSFKRIGEKTLLLNARRIFQKTQGRQLILLAIEDITEHASAKKIIAEREAWLRQMANNAPVMIWTTDKDKKINFFNKTWEEYTGQVPDFITDWTELIHADDRDEVIRKHLKSFGKKESFTTEYRLRRKDGEFRWVLTSVKPFLSADGAFQGFIATVADIHDQKMFMDKLEHRVTERTNELENANRHLEQSNDELRQFAFVASHDLQEPLRKILTFSNLIKSLFGNNRSAEIGPYIDKITESSDRMSRLIDDLLNFSRSTLTDEKFVTVDLDKIVADVLQVYELSTAQNNIVVKTGNLGTIPGIEIQIMQLFQNLIGNAIKFCAGVKKPSILISRRTLKKNELPPFLDAERRYAEFRIQDNGIGFDPQFAEQIFVIFQRLHDRKTFPGTGIGLALCKKIVANHRGHIYAESADGNGAAFHVILPEDQPSATLAAV